MDEKDTPVVERRAWALPTTLREERAGAFNEVLGAHPAAGLATDLGNYGALTAQAQTLGVLFALRRDVERWSTDRPAGPLGEQAIELLRDLATRLDDLISEHGGVERGAE